MRKKAIKVAVFFAAIISVVGIVNGLAKRNKSTIKTNNLPSIQAAMETTWKEVPIEDGKYIANAANPECDLKNIIGEADYVFSGTIIDRKEYEVEWKDEEGELWGPFPSSVIEVKINKEYYGESPVSGDSIKVYYPYSLSTNFEDSFMLKENGEYVFITNALDEEFIERRSKEAPDDKFYQEKYADVYISDNCYRVMPIEEEKVIMYHDYFYWNDSVMEQTITGEAVETDKILSDELLEEGWFITLDNNDFEHAFLKLFENVENLPDVNKMKDIHKMKSGKYFSND